MIEVFVFKLNKFQKELNFIAEINFYIDTDFHSSLIAISGGRSPEVTIEPVTGDVTIRTCTEVR